MPAIPPLSYLVPFTFSTMPGGGHRGMRYKPGVSDDPRYCWEGTGTSENTPRELSEIEEEIMQDVTLTDCTASRTSRGICRTWLLVTNHRIKSSLMHQYCPANEKVTLVQFQVEIAGKNGSFQLVFPTSFLNALLKQIKLEQPQHKGGLRYFPARSMRERVLDCDVEIEAGLPRMKVAVRDLVAFQPGFLLKLCTPVRTPGMLTVGGLDIFEATPVRNGSKKGSPSWLPYATHRVRNGVNRWIIRVNYGAARIFASAFAESFAESLTLKLGTPWLLKALDDATPARPEEPSVSLSPIRRWRIAG